MSATGRDRPAVELLKSVVWTVQLALFVALALGPVVAGFLVPLGPPQYEARVVDVAPAESASGTAYSELSADSRELFDRVVAAEDDTLTRRPSTLPSLLEPGDHTVVRGAYAYHIEVTKSEPLRPAAIGGGVLAGGLGTLVGAAVLSRDVAP